MLRRNVDAIAIAAILLGMAVGREILDAVPLLLRLPEMVATRLAACPLHQIVIAPFLHMAGR